MIALSGCSAVVPQVTVASTTIDRPNLISLESVEPNAGTWKTWILKSGKEIRPATPPTKAATEQELKDLQILTTQRDAKALSQIAFWDAGSPSYRWQDIALAQVVKNPAANPPPRAVRMMALMNVAIYDALIAAWDAKYAFNRPRPSMLNRNLTTVVAVPDSPSYPAEHAVVAGAASTLLSYIYPNDAKTFEALAQQAGQSRVLAGVQYPSDITAGFELGHNVAIKVIERAKGDNSDAKWTGTVPSGPGHWIGDKPLEPLAGTWKPWVLKSGDQFRPPEPPAYNSAKLQTEMAEVKSFTHTFAVDSKAMYWQTPEGVYYYWYNTGSQRLFEHHLDVNPPRAARMYALMSIVHNDASIACYDAKYAYWAIRPAQLDKDLKPLFPTPSHPSYPSAHGCYSGAIAKILEYLFPDEAKAIHDKADEAALSRLWAGIHFRSDMEVGLKLGRQVADVVIDQAKVDGSR